MQNLGQTMPNRRWN